MKPTLLFLLVCLVTGCAQPLPAATPTLTSIPTRVTLSPSPTPSPTVEPSLTPTPQPTATVHLSPTATVLPEPGKPLAGQHAYQIQVEGGAVRFLLYFPESFVRGGDAQKYPMILFLHGGGEAGSQVEQVADTGLPQRLEEEKDFPFIVVSPQIPAPPPGYNASNIDDYLVLYGWSSWVERLDGLLDWLETHLAVDPQREYLTGLSLGGFGTWEYALRHPARFAAIAPIAGGLEYARSQAPDSICSLKDLPVWAFHGEQDQNVAPSYTTVLIEALRKCGGSPKLTLYPDEDHSGAWDKAYSGQDLFDWLLTHQK